MPFLKFLNLSKNISSLSTGVVTSYALYILIGFIAYISITLLSSNLDLVLLLILSLFSLSSAGAVNTKLQNLYSSSSFQTVNSKNPSRKTI